MAVLVCLGASVEAQTVGFTADPVNTTRGTYQDAANGGVLNIGRTMTVSGSGIEVLQLGVYDYQSDGMAEAHTVTLFNADSQTALATVTVPSGTGSPLINAYRFVTLPTPVFLPAGHYAVVAYHMDDNDPYGNGNAAGINGSPNLSGNAGLYDFVNSVSPAYPGSGSGEWFASGSFTYTNVPTWMGGTSSDWSDPSNWQSGVEPSGITMVNTASGNLATVSTEVTANQPTLLDIGEGVAGIVDVQTGGNLTVNGETWLGNASLGQGTMNISDGTYTGNSWYAVGRGGGHGTVNMTGGTLNVNNNPVGVGLDANSVGVFNQNGGVVNANDQLWIGNNDQGGGQNSATYILTNGTMVVNSWTVIGQHNTVGVLNISGGSLTKTSSGDQMLIGVDQDSSTGIINQTGGAITNTASDTYLAGYNAGTGVWNLSGGYAVLGLLQLCHNNDGNSSGTMNLNTSGTLIVSSVGYGGGGASTATLNFNGGTLMASGANATFMGGLTRANIRNGGAIIDDGGYAITISQPLLHSSIGGDHAIDGGLTKNGAGTLELSGANNYTGDTTVNAGTLQLDVTGSSVGALRLANGTTLNLNLSGGNYAVAAFYTNGVSLPVGAYSSGNLPAFISGSGNLVVSSSISTGLWTGAGADNDWSTAGNWDQNAVPIFPHALTFAGSTRLVNTNDLSNITVSSLTFDAAAGAFVLDGNSLTNTGGISFNGNPAAPVTQTVNLGMTFTADLFLNGPTNGTLTLGGIDTMPGLIINDGTNIITGNVTVNGTGSDVFYLANANPAFHSALVIQPGATLSVIGSYGDDGVIGRDGGSGTVIQNGGTFTYNNNRANMWVGATGNAATRSEYDMNGGLLDMSGHTLGVGLGAGVLITGLVSQVSGIITNVGNLWLGGATAQGYGA